MIKSDSIKYQLLEMVGLCGEFPSGQLNRLIESDSYAEKLNSCKKAVMTIPP